MYWSIDLQREVLLVPEVVVEGALRRARGREQGLHAEVVVAVLEQHGEPGIEQALLGRVRLLPLSPCTFRIMWSMTWLCSCCGLNMTISASASTCTLCPGGQ